MSAVGKIVDLVRLGRSGPRFQFHQPRPIIKGIHQRLQSGCTAVGSMAPPMARPRAALAARALILAAAVAVCAAVPLKVPTARPGECWDTLTRELKASELPGKVKGSGGEMIGAACRHDPLLAWPPARHHPALPPASPAPCCCCPTPPCCCRDTA